MKRTLIVGCEGQDGRLLFERCESEGDNVLGLGRGRRRMGHRAVERVEAVDILDREAVASIVQAFLPDEVYFLAAVHQASEGKVTQDGAVLFHASFDIHVKGLIHFLEALRYFKPSGRLLYAASSHIFGHPEQAPQSEDTPINPVSIYGITKAAGVHCCRYYRDTHGVFASVAILFNHESLLRRPEFVSRKIIDAVTRIQRGEKIRLILGDLSALVDWGYAPDYIMAMRCILALPDPSDMVVGTGQSHSVGEFVELAFRAAGMDWKNHVDVNPNILTKPQSTLVGDSSRLHASTGWKPSITFEEMVRGMVIDGRLRAELGDLGNE